MNTKTDRKWMALDNAALIYPAARNRNWTALFRISAELSEPVDRELLQAALLKTLRRFPSFSVRLRHGAFWYFLEQIDIPPLIQEDVANPCVRMDFKKDNGYMFRVRCDQRRIALEVFHVLADGTGGLCFLETLVAEYLTLRYGVNIPRDERILDCKLPPDPAEYEDSFPKHAGKESLNRGESAAFRIRGEITPHYMHIISGTVDSLELKRLADSYGVSVGVLLTSLLILAADEMQRKKKPARPKPVKINVPVNLRRYFPSRTMRNFSSYVNPGIDPRFGEYDLPEVCKLVKHYMGYEVTEKRMRARITTNVKTQQNTAVRILPMALKRYVLKAVYLVVGDRYSTGSLSNLGVVKLPEEMARYVTRMDLMLGPLHSNPVTCACLSYNGKTNINFTRTIRETDLERGFFTRLVKLGVHVRLESNERY